MTSKATRRFKTKTEWLRAADLNVDPTYQRDLNRAAVRVAVEDFKPDALGVLHISRRTDDSLWVIDGQHRREYLIQSGLGDTKVKCEVYHGLTIHDEAILFVELNKTVNMRAIDLFIARLGGGDIDAIRIAEICEKHNLKIDKRSDDGLISCVAALERVYRGKGAVEKKDHHADDLDHTLTILVSAFGPTAEAVNGTLVDGIGQMVLRFGSLIDTDRLIKKLAGVPQQATGVIGNARGVKQFRGGSLAHALAEYVVDLYNRGLRTNRLPDWR